MQPAPGERPAGQRDIHLSRFDRPGQRLATKLLTTGLERRLQLFLEPVRRGAQRPPLMDRQLAERAQDARQPPSAAEVRHAPRFQRTLVGGDGEFAAGLRLEVFQWDGSGHG